MFNEADVRVGARVGICIDASFSQLVFDFCDQKSLSPASRCIAVESAQGKYRRREETALAPSRARR